MTGYFIRRNGREMIEGDSTAATGAAANGYLTHEVFTRSIRSRFETPVPTGTAPSEPTITNFATNGATTNTLAARFAGEIAAVNPTGVHFQVGVNDATTGVLRTTTSSNMSTMVGQCPAGCKILIAGPLCAGELWPSGQNANDTALVNIDTDMAALAAADTTNRAFVSQRHSIYDVEEPLLNSASPGVDPGPLCRNDLPTPSKHGNATLARFYGALLKAAAPLG